jgi:hypothetical protein
LQTTTAVVSVPLNQASNINKASEPSTIGNLTVGPLPFDGYMAEVYFIDGQALTPSSFGNTNDQTGVWQPIAYTGTYGTNGFYLPFSNTASTSTLGNDFSGNSNNWTTNNISLTSGSTYDSMVDVPTQWIPYNTAGDTGSLFRGSYCTGNWLNQTDLDILREGNLYWKMDNERAVTGTIAVSSGKWYWEVTAGTIQNFLEIGIVGTNAYFSGPNNFAPGSISTGYSYRSNGTKINNNSSTSYGATFTTGDVIGVAFDADAGTLTFYKNNVSQGTAYSSIPVRDYVASGYGGPAAGTTGGYWNFGQRPFAYTPPSGFKTLNTTNLPTPTIGATASTQANRYMDATLFTATAGTNTIVNAGGFQPDLVWIKSRNNPQNHYLVDSVRGGTSLLQPNITNAESIYSTPAWIISFNSNGFTSSTDSLLSTSYTYVGWQWRASNTTAVTNTDGTITSTVSANTTAGFSIVTYTGNGTNGATVGHGLGAKPFLIIEKGRTSAYNWSVQGCGELWTPATSTLFLNTTNALNSGGAVTAPTSTVFTPSVTNYANESGVTNIAYCFAQVAGYSAFGSYTGNGSSDGTFVYTGFRPAFLLIKRTDSAGGWYTYDDARSTYNLNATILQPNLSDAEFTGTNNSYDFLSNGFKARGTGGDNNASGGTYIYMAFCESPFKFSNAR